MLRPGDVPALGCQHFFTGVFGFAARIPDRQVSSAQSALQVLAGCGGFVMQGQRNLSRGCVREVMAQGQTFSNPAVNAAIQIVISLVADDIQQPDKPPGPTTAFVVIHHIDRVWPVAQLTEQRFQRRLRRQQAGRRWQAQLRAFRVDEASPRNMPGFVTRNAGQVDQDQFGSVEPGKQVARFNH